MRITTLDNRAFSKEGKAMFRITKCKVETILMKEKRNQW
jgi:hypothetical protein